MKASLVSRNSINLWIRNFLIIIAASLFLFAVYKIFTKEFDRAVNHRINEAAKKIYYSDPAPNSPAPASGVVLQPREFMGPDPENIVSTPTSVVQTGKPEVLERFKPLLLKNKDIVGWVKLDETMVDYPVVQAADNTFYLSHDLLKQSNKAGAIFMDYRDRLDKENRNIILYGHDMLDKSMFAPIMDYESKWFFDHHPVIHFDTIYQNMSFRVFSAYTTDVSFDYRRTEFADSKEYKVFLESLQAKSLYKADVGLTVDDTILTLSTCSYAFDNARFVVHAKLLQDAGQEKTN